MFTLFRSLVLIFIVISPVQGIATHEEEAHKSTQTHYLESKKPMAYRLAIGIKSGVIGGFCMGMSFWGISKAQPIPTTIAREKNYRVLAS